MNYLPSKLSQRDIFASIFLLLIITYSAISCNQDSGDPEDAELVASIEITSLQDTLRIGFSGTLQMRAIAYDANGGRLSGIGFQWSAEGNGGASIDPNGLLQATKAGNVQITATAENVSRQKAIVVEISEKESFSNQGVFLFQNVQLIPMTSDMVVENQDVLVQDGIIREIGLTGTLSQIPDVTIIDGNGGYLMPGMADMHTHIGANVLESGISTNVALDRSESSRGQLLGYLANGVTTVLNAGDFNDPITFWAKEARNNVYPSPTIYAANWPRGPQDGFGGGRDLQSAAEAREYVRTSKQQGYDFIKLYNQTPAFAIGPLIETAEQEGMAVVGHFPVTSSAQRTLDQGMHLVAHAEAFFWTHFGFQHDDSRIESAVQMMVNNEATLTTTLAIVETIASIWGGNREGINALNARPSLRYAHYTSLAIWQRGYNGPRWNPTGSVPGGYDANFEFVKKYVHRMHDAGVPMLTGTDSPTVLGVAGFSMLLELDLLHRMGFTPYEILEMACSNPGKFVNKHIFSPLPFGTLEVGSRADMILLEANPLEDIKNVDQRIGVMARGNWFSEEFLQAELEKLAQSYGN